MDENQIPELNQPQTLPKTGLKEQFTTVTPVSKFLAMMLFVSLPFIGFWFGLQYRVQIVPNNEITPPPVSSINNTGVTDEKIVGELPETGSIELLGQYYDGVYKSPTPFKTIVVRGKLSCSGNVAILLAWPNPYGDPLPYLELYSSYDDSGILWIPCDDPWYVTRVSSDDAVASVKGVLVPRQYGEQFPDPYLNLPDREREIIKYRGSEFFIVDRSY